MLIIRNLKKYIGIFLFDFNATIFALFFSFLSLSLFRLPVSVTDIQIALPLLIVSQFIMNVALGLYEDSLRESYSGLFKRAFLSNAIASPMAVSFVLFLDVGLARIADVSFLFIAVFLVSVITLQSSWRYFVFDKGWGRTEKEKS